MIYELYPKLRENIDEIFKKHGEYKRYSTKRSYRDDFTELDKEGNRAMKSDEDILQAILGPMITDRRGYIERSNEAAKSYYLPLLEKMEKDENIQKKTINILLTNIKKFQENANPEVLNEARASATADLNSLLKYSGQTVTGAGEEPVSSTATDAQSERAHDLLKQSSAGIPNDAKVQELGVSPIMGGAISSAFPVQALKTEMPGLQVAEESTVTYGASHSSITQTGPEPVTDSKSASAGIDYVYIQADIINESSTIVETLNQIKNRMPSTVFGVYGNDGVGDATVKLKSLGLAVLPKDAEPTDVRRFTVLEHNLRPKSLSGDNIRYITVDDIHVPVIALLTAIFRYKDIFAIENISDSDKEALYGMFEPNANGIRIKKLTGDKDDQKHILDLVAQNA